MPLRPRSRRPCRIWTSSAARPARRSGGDLRHRRAAEGDLRSARLARPEATLVWAVKADPAPLPLDLAAALAARADIVVFSRGEAEFAAEAISAGGGRPARRNIRIETRGPDGVAFLNNGATTVFSVNPVETEAFATGAGDTFIGGFLAAWVKTPDPEGAVKAGIASRQRTADVAIGRSEPD